MIIKVNDSGYISGKVDIIFYPTSLPLVTTAPITDISLYTATGGGEVTHDGSVAIVYRGICWGTSENPTVVDTSTQDASITGVGSYISYLTGLNPSTHYHVRAFAYSSAGTTYGIDVSFNTAENILLFSFITNTTIFDPSFGVTSGILKFDLGDASTTVDYNNFTHSYSTVGEKTVNVHIGTTDGCTSITSLEMNNDGLVGTLDIDALISLTSLKVQTNPSLNTITNPVSSAIFTNYYAYDCCISGVLDVSGLSGLGSDFDVSIKIN